MVVWLWLECLGPLQLPGSAHRYLQVIKKPSDSSEELQSISNEAGSSNGIKNPTIASTKETTRFAKLHQWIDYIPVSISMSSKMLVPQWAGWFSHIFHPRNAHKSMIASSKPLSIIISKGTGISHYIIISSHEITMKSPQTHGWLRWFPRHHGGLCAFAAGSSQHRHYGHGKFAETWWNPMKSHGYGSKWKTDVAPQMWISLV